MKPQPDSSTQEVLAGLIERVTYHNTENGFCVLRAKARGHRDLVTVVGHAATIAAGEWVTASGEWVNDRTHGQQFKARFLRTSPPTSAQVPAEKMVTDVKEYISETICDPEVIYDPKIWDTPGFALILSWLAQKWLGRCRKLAPRSSKNPGQYLTKEQQKACLDTAVAELIREITHKGSFN
jgi:hypothetical protein